MRDLFNNKSLLLLCGVFAFVLVFIFIITSFLPKSASVKELSLDATPTPLSNSNSPASGDTTQTPSTNNIKYVGDDRLEQIAITKHALDPHQKDIKDALIRKSLQSNDYNLTSESDFSINYIQAFDEFQVEILTIDYKKVQTEAIDYLRSQGLSDDTICNLPVTFYLSYDVTQQLQDKKIEVNVLPDFCK